VDGTEWRAFPGFKISTIAIATTTGSRDSIALKMKVLIKEF